MIMSALFINLRRKVKMADVNDVNVVLCVPKDLYEQVPLYNQRSPERPSN